LNKQSNDGILERFFYYSRDGEQNYDRYFPKNSKKISEIFGYQKKCGNFFEI
jgi:hypothetical protein